MLETISLIKVQASIYLILQTYCIFTFLLYYYCKMNNPFEAWRERRSQRRQEEAARLAERQVKLDQAKDEARQLEDKMRGIEVYPGSLGEYREMHPGQEYEIVPLEGPNQYLTGGLGRRAWAYEPYYRDSVPRVETDGSIIASAARVGADAIVRLTKLRDSYATTHYQGVPVRKRPEQVSQQQ